MAVGLLFSAATALQAQERLTQTGASKQATVTLHPSVTSTVTPSPMKAPRKGISQEDILISEDFSAFTSGTIETPDTTRLLASEYYEPGIYLDPSLTKDGTWAGSFVYSAGGTAYLKTPNPQVMASLMTPLGDYSGDLTITCRVKALPDWIVTGENEDGSYKWARLTGSSFGIMICTGGYENANQAKCDETPYESVRLYENQGWVKVTYTIKNYSADNDGYICFYTVGAVLLDDVQVTSATTFVAGPKMLGITDFQKDQFTIAWEPTRKAFNYYVDLYKKVQVSDEDGVFQLDFEDYTPSADWATDATELSDTEGADGSNGLILRNEQSIATPTNNSNYKTAHFYLKVEDPTAREYEAEYGEFWVYMIGGEIYLEGLTLEGWKEIGYFNAMAFADGDEVKLEEEMSKFANNYMAIRLRAEDFNEGEYLVVDNFDITTEPATEMVPVDGENSMHYGGDYDLYDSTNGTQYTFTNLDPETEYYYGVRAHYVNLFSERVLYHALGVSAPEVKEATDIDSRGTFTANWEAAPKADGYTVNLYGVQQLTADNDDFVILEENFDAIDATVTEATDVEKPENIGNSDEETFDDYTALPGWTGKLNTVVQGMLGCADSWYSTATITTPTLYVAGSDKLYVRIKAYGTDGDNLILNTGEGRYAIPFDGGVIDGDYMVPVSAETVRITMYSYNMYPFMIDAIRFSQSLKKGQTVYSWLQKGDTDAETLSYTFNGLSDYDYNLYAFDVTSHFTYQGQTVSSKPSAKMHVDLENGSSTMAISVLANIDSTMGNDAPISVFTLDGRRSNNLGKGINIVRMADGTVRKIIRK